MHFRQVGVDLARISRWLSHANHSSTGRNGKVNLESTNAAVEQARVRHGAKLEMAWLLPTLRLRYTVSFGAYIQS